MQPVQRAAPREGRQRPIRRDGLLRIVVDPVGQDEHRGQVRTGPGQGTQGRVHAAVEVGVAAVGLQGGQRRVPAGGAGGRVEALARPHPGIKGQEFDAIGPGGPHIGIDGRRDPPEDDSLAVAQPLHAAAGVKHEHGAGTGREWPGRQGTRRRVAAGRARGGLGQAGRNQTEQGGEQGNAADHAPPILTCAGPREVTAGVTLPVA